MLYAILQPLMRLALRIFFRKIYFSNAEVIPWGKPLIIASNHPTAFMEPLIYCSLLRQPLHSITRGDVFTHPFFGKILKSLYMVPIFRFKDGFGNLKLNNASFEHCYQTLADNKAILIFSEGRTKLEKRLRPIQKGTARMAFGTWESLGNTDLDIQIVPVGLNYVSGNCFRDEVMIRFDAPISLRDYEKMYHENPIRSVTKLTEELKNRLEKSGLQTILGVGPIRSNPAIENCDILTCDVTHNDLNTSYLLKKDSVIVRFIDCYDNVVYQLVRPTN